MPNKLNLKSESNNSFRYFDDLSHILRLKGEILTNEIYQLDNLCYDEKVKVSKSFDEKKNGDIEYNVKFEIDRKYSVFFSLKSNIEDEYIANEYSVYFNKVSKYRGYKLIPAINEVIACIKEIIDKRKGYDNTPEYKCSLFKIKYLYAFKKFLDSGEVDKNRLEYLLKNMVNQRTFITNSFIRNIYSLDKIIFLIDTYNNDSYKITIYSGNNSYECESINLVDCIRKLYFVAYPC